MRSQPVHRTQNGTENVYLPCLFARLTDLHPEAKTEATPHLISLAELRYSVLMNAIMLLNSGSHVSSSVWAGMPEVGDSVLGYGLEDFCGATYSRARREKLRRDIQHQLAVFEPRLDKNATEVIVYASDEGGTRMAGLLEVEIRSLLSVEPLKEEFVFRARLNLESGEARLVE